MPLINHNKNNTRLSDTLKRTFCELLNKKSFEDIYVNEICATSGYSRNAFYYHYEDKYQFAKKMIDDEIDVYVNMVLTFRKKQSPSYTPGPGDISYLFFDHVYKNKHIYEVLLKKDILPDTIKYFCIEAYNKIKQHLLYEFIGKPAIYTDYLHYISVHLYWITIQYWSDNHYSFSPVFITDFFNTFVSKQTNAIISEKSNII